MTTTLSQNLLTTTKMNNTHPGESLEGIQEKAIPKDFLKLKEISEKLNLSTRRPSVIQWKQIIEYRKSRGQYVTSSHKLQYLDTSVDKQLSKKDEVQTKSKFNEAKTDNTANIMSLFQESNTDTALTMTHDSISSSSLPTIVSTPVRRHRRSGQIETPTLIVEGPAVKIKIDDVTDYVTNSSTLSNQPVNNDSLTVIDGNQAKSSNRQDANSSAETSARYRNINQAFETIRRELVLLRIEDNKLARKLLDIRREMNLMRAQLSCEEHADMLDDVTYELLEEEELTELIKACDLSDGKPGSLFSNFSPLRSIGVSRMNLNTRRFSIR